MVVVARNRSLPMLMLLVLTLATACLRQSATTTPLADRDLENGALRPYGDYSSKDLSSLDLSQAGAVLATITFDNYTAWPRGSRMPKEFSPTRLLAWGKAPGLGVGKLHQQGIAGKGVSVAFVDQPLPLNHKGLKGIGLTYTKVRLTPGESDESSYHGPPVASLLAGREIGVAPGVKLYYYAHPPWLHDQSTHADALRAVIQQNRALPEGQKIRCVGFSDSPDPKEKNVEAYQAAIAEAEAEGILVVDVLRPVRLAPAGIQPLANKEEPKNWRLSGWGKELAGPGRLLVPADGRTTAADGLQDDTVAYFAQGGLSWSVPYVVGTLALGWQVDPGLTNQNAALYLMESATPVEGGVLINPPGFVELVRTNKR